MKNAVRDELIKFNCSYDEVIVPEATSIPIAIGAMVDNMAYEGILCLGVLVNDYGSPTYKIAFKELMRNLGDFSSYFNFPVGCGLYYSETFDISQEKLNSLACNEAASVCNTIKMIAQLNNFGNQAYAREQEQG